MTDRDTARWADFEEQAPRLASAIGERLLGEGTGAVTYLATVRRDHTPRVMPVRVFVHDGDACFMTFPTSAKAQDLRANPNFAAHVAIGAAPGAASETHFRGTVELIDDAARTETTRAGAPFARPPSAGTALFVLRLERAAAGLAGPDGPIRLRWRASTGLETEEQVLRR